MTILQRFFPLSVLFMPGVALAAPRTFAELAFQFVELLDLATVTLVVFALVVYFWGMAVNIQHFGGEKGEKKRKAFFFWGIAVLFVMVSIWGIIQLLQNTLFSSSAFSPNSGAPAYTLCDSFGNCGFGAE